MVSLSDRVRWQEDGPGDEDDEYWDEYRRRMEDMYFCQKCVKKLDVLKEKGVLEGEIKKRVESVYKSGNTRKNRDKATRAFMKDFNLCCYDLSDSVVWQEKGRGLYW